MPIRITGLNSGLDTESIISALVSSYSYKTDKYKKAQTKLSWKQDAWKTLNTKVYSLYKNVGNLKLQSSYNLRKTTVSDTTKATVMASGSVTNGSYSVQVTQLAKAGYLTGAELKSKTEGTKITSSTLVSELSGGIGSFKIKVGNSETSIGVGADTKISDVVSQLKKAGVNASFDEKNQRFFISAKESGAANDFDLIVNENANANSIGVLKALGIYENTEITGDAISVNASEMTVLSNLGCSVGDSFKITVDGAETEITVGANATIDNILTQLNTAGVNASIQDGKLKIEAREGSEFSIEAGNGQLLTKLGLKETSTATKIDGQGSIIYVNGAKFEGETNNVTVNGLTIQATGVTDTTYDPTGAKAFNVTVSTDTQGIYDKIKDFLSEYNALINEMTSLYNSESAKGYEPLTDEEKDAMSDSEVEKWEEKIKASLLRRDDTLSGLINAMTSTMSKGAVVGADENGQGGKRYYLSDFGIKTLGFLNAPKNEQNAYHIDGDEDDVNTAGNTDKLMQALTEDPDTVINFMKELSENLYKSIDTKMKSTSLSSIYTVYNDKEMASEYSDYTSTITKWQERLEQQEEYYYNKFAQMESAMAKLNSQSSSMSGFFGM